MKVILNAIFSVQVTNTTLIFVVGDQTQSFSLPDGKTVRLDPKLEGSATVNTENKLIIAKPSAILITEDLRFESMDIVVPTQAEVRKFLLDAQSDPDVARETDQMLTALSAMGLKILEDVVKVLEVLPEHGAVRKLVTQLKAVSWAEDMEELSGAIKTALPKTWDIMESLVATSTVSWIKTKVSARTNKAD